MAPVTPRRPAASAPAAVAWSSQVQPPPAESPRSGRRRPAAGPSRRRPSGGTRRRACRRCRCRSGCPARRRSARRRRRCPSRRWPPGCSSPPCRSRAAYDLGRREERGVGQQACGPSTPSSNSRSSGRRPCRSSERSTAARCSLTWVWKTAPRLRHSWRRRRGWRASRPPGSTPPATGGSGRGALAVEVGLRPSHHGVVGFGGAVRPQVVADHAEDAADARVPGRVRDDADVGSMRVPASQTVVKPPRSDSSAASLAAR